MSDTNEEIGSSIERARERERQYAWPEAAQIYQSALAQSGELPALAAGDLHERQAYALHRTAFLADSREAFRDESLRAIEVYESAKECYGRAAAHSCDPCISRCDAMIAFIRFWCSDAPQDKKSLINLAWQEAKRALNGFHEKEEWHQYCRTFYQLALCTQISDGFGGDYALRHGKKKELADISMTVAESVSDSWDADLQVSYLVAASCGMMMLSNSFEINEEAKYFSRAAGPFWQKAMAISERTSQLEMVRNILDSSPPVHYDTKDLIRLMDRLLEDPGTSKDKLVLGIMYDWSQGRIYSELSKAESSEDLLSAVTEGLRLAHEARKSLSLIGYVPLEMGWSWCMAPEFFHYLWRAFYESDLRLKRQLADKALEHTREIIEGEWISEIPDLAADSDFYQCVSLATMAKAEPRTTERRNLLERAAQFGRRGLDLWELQHPYRDLSIAWCRNVVSEAECELAILIDDHDSKVRSLREALISRKRLTDRGVKAIAGQADVEKATHAVMALWVHEIGAWEKRLHVLTGEGDDLRGAVKAFGEAAAMYEKASSPARVAECHWQAAMAQSELQEHLEAEKEFSKAAEAFRRASEDISQLKALYEDHSVYMQAWAALEQAKHRHAKREYDLSKESYEKAASLLHDTKGWTVFSDNYAAWATVEEAENLSVLDNNEESANAFREASRLFRESKSTIDASMSSMDQDEQREMAARLVAASDIRQEYCSARMMIETARTLDKLGQESTSAERYSEAARILEKILESLKTDQERNDIQLVLVLCRAWQKMVEAEATVDPSKFSQAADLFEEAKDLSSDKKAKLLAAGHARFCLALEAGMKFSDTGDSSLHVDATRHLESAAKYYVRAGYKNASEYTNASKLLFDGYVHMDRASREDDQEKRAKSYMLAEKVLEASASSFELANYPGKRDFTRELLEKVRRDKQLAISLAKALQAPDIVSSTNPFSTPTPIQEKAVGAEKFEHADVQATMIGRPAVLNVGDDFRLEIEVVNAGKGTAQLTKVDGIAPKGFEIREVPERYRMQDSFLDMRGRRLDALKTEDVKVVLRPKMQGSFRLRPRILYLDDTGKYRSQEPEPIEVTVRELGISGWLRGPDRNL